MLGQAKISLLALVVVSSILGCSSEPAQSRVKGIVTLDGQPLAKGLIHFVALDAGAPTAEATITAGQYEAVVPPGEKRVEIRAPKITGKEKVYDSPESPMVDVVSELLPTRYNVDSTLTTSVGDGDQEKSFELTAK